VNLTIDFISDITCPWCAVGLFSLEEALRRTAGTVQASVRFQPFELNPAMGPEGQNIDEHLGAKYGRSPQQLAEGRATLRERAAGVGLAMNTSAHSRTWNTFDAHRLLHWAGLEGRQLELQRTLFRSHFTEDANLGDPAVLVAAAQAAGLDAGSAREVLASGRYAGAVREAEQYWQSRGIRSVPSLVIDGKWLISGGQPPETFEQALRQIAAEKSAASAATAATSGTTGDS
jgi:predicted DsbA family dithiol-disulfide isomerase